MTRRSPGVAITVRRSRRDSNQIRIRFRSGDCGDRNGIEAYLLPGSPLVNLCQLTPRVILQCRTAKLRRRCAYHHRPIIGPAFSTGTLQPFEKSTSGKMALACLYWLEVQL